MKITDYSKVAENYDRNKVRYDISKDETIETLYNINNTDFTVLDLSCGTGNYLKRQIAAYPLPNYKINWIGIDKSEDMVKLEKEKVVKEIYRVLKSKGVLSILNYEVFMGI
jgi:ubiquinone/menaquinone biosynthesis C-methylase UbiE